MISETNRSDKDVLLKQYEQAWQQIEHFDSSYVQLTLLYMALIGAYIGSSDKFTGNPILISLCLAVVCLCVVGIIWRLRKLIDQQLGIISEIEIITLMKNRPRVKGLGTVRTSTYLTIIVAIMTLLAMFLTLNG